MDRQIVYAGAIPLDTDQLSQNKNVLIAFGMAMRAILGTSTFFDGLACSPTGPASLQVLVGPGSVYALENVDGTAYGSLGSDTTHQIVKQGINLATLTLNCPAPGTTGQSINYLIQSAYQDTDTGATVLPYYNSSNPSVAYNGPGNSGTSQNTVRQGQCLVAVKTGVAATTGSQVTPAPDAGYTGLWVVTVANGQTTITSPNIALASGAPFISEKLNDKISIPTGDARYLQLGVGIRTRLSGNKNYYVATTGNDSTGDGSSGNPWLTIQYALNFIQQNIDLAGNVAVVNVANGTYTAGASINSPFTGGGGVAVVGNNTTPGSCIINLGSTTGATAFLVSGGAALSISGLKLTGTGTGSSGIDVNTNGYVNIINNMEFGALAGSHLNCQDSGSIIQISTSVYSITGNASAHISSAYGGEVQYGNSCTVTLTGTLSFSSAFISSVLGGIVIAGSETYSGSATGTRYIAASNGVILTNGGGASFFPGSVSGSTSTGGQYV